jgi:O-methyltransferase domain/Dimerisation domain
MLVSGFRATQLVRAVTELRIPDLLADGPRSAADLAEAAGVMTEPLRRALRALVAVGVFDEVDGGRFAATPVSDWFRDRPGSMRGIALMLPAESYRAFGDLMYSLKTGEPAFEHIYSMSRWEQLAQEPEQSALFNSSMQFNTEAMRDAVASAYDFTGLFSVVDVGGGRGTLIAGLLKANPGLRGVVFDIEAGLAETEAYLKQEGVHDRCAVKRGSFFDQVPSGHDAYVLKNIIHDWSDEKAAVILANCRKAMSPEQRLILIERIVPARSEDSASARQLFMADMQMMVMLGGRERTLDEFRALVEGAGFQLTRVIPTESAFQLIEAIPA